MGSDDSAILAVHEAWLKAELSGNVDALLALCTSDIRFFPPGCDPLEGTSAVRILLESAQTRPRDIRTADIRIEVSASLAFKSASFSTVLASPASSSPSTVSGHHLWILRREQAGWRVAAVAWSIRQ
jgi:ketosteroid isomerase-like protein